MFVFLSCLALLGCFAIPSLSWAEDYSAVVILMREHPEDANLKFVVCPSSGDLGRNGADEFGIDAILGDRCQSIKLSLQDSQLLLDLLGRQARTTKHRTEDTIFLLGYILPQAGMLVLGAAALDGGVFGVLAVVVSIAMFAVATGAIWMTDGDPIAEKILAEISRFQKVDGLDEKSMLQLELTNEERIHLFDAFREIEKKSLSREDDLYYSFP